MKIGLAQINPIVGDLSGNARKIIDAAHEAKRHGAHLVVMPELCLVGYPPMDLLDKQDFIRQTGRAVGRIAREAPDDIGILIGAPVENDGPVGKRLQNAAILLEAGEVVGQTHKNLLPTYDVFDEYRYFEPGSECNPIFWRGLRMGVHICEDMWNNEDEVPYHLYDTNPVDALAAQGIDLFVNISASPFSTGKSEVRAQIIRDICREHRAPFVLVNQVGANTELVFDGRSGVWDAGGERILAAAAFETDLMIWDTRKDLSPIDTQYDDLEDLHRALVLGVRDYFWKTGIFEKALIGLSGGIDSAVTCAIAVEALGAERVMGVTMPSKYSSSGSVTDSEMLARAMGIRMEKISIEPAVNAFSDMLGSLFEGTPPGTAEENIQARTRGLVLMAISNKFNHLLLTTGNKSEMAVGYATLYGDMNGGLAVLADVLKTDVYRLAEYINRAADREMIPRSTIEKPPSAELRPDQMDQDSLPPYEVLDTLLELYVERLLEADEIVAQTGYDGELVLDVLGKVDRNEYKRRQAAPGLRVSGKAFGIGRRLPIVMRWTR